MVLQSTFVVRLAARLLVEIQSMKPPYDPATSDGCSVPAILRMIVPQETPAQRGVCVCHDEAYYYGGTRRQRAIADAKLLLGMLQNEMDVDEAHRFHAAVRIMGKSHWDDGTGCLNRYSDDPPLTGRESIIERPGK